MVTSLSGTSLCGTHCSSQPKATLAALGGRAARALFNQNARNQQDELVLSGDRLQSHFESEALRFVLILTWYHSIIGAFKCFDVTNVT